MRSRLSSEFHLALPLLGLASLTLADGAATRVFGANHPSLIAHAA